MSARRRAEWDGSPDVAWRWPLFVSIGMFLVAFVPGVGLVTLLLVVPVGFFLVLNFLSRPDKMHRIYLGVLFLLGSAVVAIIVSTIALFGWSRA